jgi:hypothetical protein
VQHDALAVSSLGLSRPGFPRIRGRGGDLQHRAVFLKHSTNYHLDNLAMLAHIILVCTDGFAALQQNQHVSIKDIFMYGLEKCAAIIIFSLT